MELLLGSHVRETGDVVGRVAGFELHPTTLKVHRLIFSSNGELGAQTESRPVAAISMVHSDGMVDLRPVVEELSPPNVVTVGRTTIVRPNDRESGHLLGIDIEPGDRLLLGVTARAHLWSHRISIEASKLDFSTAGEIRARSGEAVPA
jgi:hypothetical protein